MGLLFIQAGIVLPVHQLIISAPAATTSALTLLWFL